MFIKKVKKKNRGFEKEFTYYHLVESVRTDKGPRQKLILNLGVINIDDEKLEDLSDCLKHILDGNNSDFGLFSFDEEIVDLADKIKEKVLIKKSNDLTTCKTESYTPCNIDTINASKARSIGAEYVANETWDLLDLNSSLQKIDLTEAQISLCKAQVIGRLCNPGSDLSTWQWVNERSGLYELIPEPDSKSLNSFYRAADKILESKDNIEQHLNRVEKALFDLPKKLCLFDLTNTFLEGRALQNPKAKFGRSKEKRSDCRLLTLGMMIDEHGFPEKTMFFEGNKSEPETLESMIEKLLSENPQINENPPMIVMDAGIASDENLEFLKKKKLQYIVVSRSRKGCSLSKDELEELKVTSSGSTIKVKKEIVGDESYLLCHSDKKELKETAMINSKETKLIEELQSIQSNLRDIKKKRVTRKTEKISEKIGRLKEKYSSVSKYYDICISNDEKNETALDLTWKLKEKANKNENTGCYLLRTSNLELTEEEIWNTYNLLTRVEASFRSIKSNTGLRPIYHQKEERADAHMFISVLAYHLINTIEYKLRQKNDHRDWSTLRGILSTHMAVTINLETLDDAGEKNWTIIRTCTNPEPTHLEIYTALEINPTPFKRKVKNFKM